MSGSLAIFPAVEANQGLISFAALSFALIAFLIQNERANRTEQHSRDEARRQEARDRESAIDFERRTAAKEIQVKRDQMDQYVGTVDALASLAETTVESAHVSTNSPGPIWRETPHFNRTMREVIASLEAVLRAAPMVAAAIIDTQKIINCTRFAMLADGQLCDEANRRLYQTKLDIQAARKSLSGLSRSV